MDCNKLIVLFLLLIYPLLIIGQDERKADSLKMYYYNNHTDDVELLLDIAQQETNPDSILKYAKLIIQKSIPDSLFRLIHNGYLQKGNAMLLKGNLDLALENYFTSMDYALKDNYELGIGKLYIAIADTYSENENSSNAARYYNKGIKILRDLHDSTSLARALINAGDEYFNVGDLDSALIYTKESEAIFNKINSPVGQAYCLGNMGMVFAKKGNDRIAEENIRKAVLLLEEQKNYYPISVYLTYMSDIYREKGENSRALDYAKQSLELAQKHGLKEQISEANLKISEIYEYIGDYHNAHLYYKEYIEYRDSVINVESLQNMGNLRTDFEVSLKQTEVDLLNQQKENQKNIRIGMTIILILVLILLISLFWYSRRISSQKKLADELLLNILPAETAEELKGYGKVQAKRFDSITVLFTDFKGFTKHSEKLTPEELVESIDFYFSKFDHIIEKYGLEKIKTIGDAYMCAGGLPFETNDHAIQIMNAAFEIAEFVNDAKNNNINNKMRFEIRIGVNTGPVVAGVVGIKKFAYDIWGDTVNVASRMESASEPGKINISENTYEIVKDYFDCEYRGEIVVKNKGMMKMYFAISKKVSSSIKYTLSQ